MDQVKNVINNSGIPQTDPSVVEANIINRIFWVVGVLAVIMIIVAGVQMITSAGDSGAVTKAKRTLVYSIVGLIVAVLAYAIVNFIIGKF
ncbi:hypothetical protein IJ095_00885 [Candidatus Saccharibacteria bacterium]|nr:hypothetical protein [Candidatus Saccharibacteria bacterium]